MPALLVTCTHTHLIASSPHPQGFASVINMRLIAFARQTFGSVGSVWEPFWKVPATQFQSDPVPLGTFLGGRLLRGD